MADPTIKLKVLLEAVGIKPTQKQLEKLSSSLQETAGKFTKVSNAANKTKRNLEGAAQRSGSAGKDFSRMSQGMGGLVQAYATVAANVFALSSAFLVLRRTADLSSMIKSAEDFSNRFGVSVTRITKQMQEASGGAISFAEALPTINKAISAGIGTEKLEQLTIAATKASQTFGGSATEALNRFISASQRGRVEIIQTLGIIIKTEQAYKDYGAIIGKTALELSAFDRQQAILSATIEASQSVFDKVNIDPNPFQQLLTTVADLKDTMGVFITDALTPMFNAFNKSKAAAAALIAVIVSSVGKRIFPALTENISGLVKAGRDSTIKAREAAARASRAAQKAEQEMGKTRGVLGIKAIREQEDVFLKSIKNRLKANSVFNKQIMDGENKVNTAILTSKRALLAREIKLREAGVMKGRQAALAGSSLPELKRMETAYNQLGLSIKNVNIAQKNVAASAKATSNSIVVFATKASAAMSRFNSTLVQSRSALKSGFAQGFQIAEGKIVKSIRGMRVAWAIFMRDIAAGTAQSGSHLANFSKAVGRTAGVVAGAFSKLVSGITSLTLYISLGVLVWEKYGDALRGISPEMRMIRDASKEFDEAIDEINERTSESIALLGDNFPNSLKKLQDALKFTSGTFASLNTTIINFQKTIVESLGGRSINDAIEDLRDLEEAQNRLENSGKKVKLATFDPTGPGKEVFVTIEDKDAAEEYRKEIEKIKDVFKELAETSPSKLFETFGQSTKLAENIGFTNIAPIIKTELDKAIKGGLFDGISSSLTGSLENALVFDPSLLERNLASVKKSLGDNDVLFVKFTNNLINLVSNINSAVESTSRSIDASLGSLTEVNSRIETFAGGLDKLRSSSGPNKDIAGFVIDINRELNSLKAIQDSTGKNKLLSDLFGDKEELARVKALLGFSKDAVVDINKAQAKAQKIEGDLRVQTIARLVGLQKIKTLSTDLATIKAREVTNGQELVRQAEEIKQKEIDIAKQKLDNITADKVAQENVIVKAKERLDVSDQELAIENEKLETLKAQERAAKAQVQQKRESRSIDDAREQVEKRILDTKIKILDIDKQITSIVLKYSKNDAQHLVLLKSQYKEQLRSFRQREEAITNEINNLRTTSEWYEQDRDILQKRLDLLRFQTAEFKQQRDLILGAITAEQSGVSIFDKEGLDTAAKFFVNKIRDEARGLKTTFEILGEGLAKNINGAFDKAVDTLLEGVWGKGGRDFADAMVETIKAGLRETFGEALKTQIRRAFGQIVDGTTDPNQGLIEANKGVEGALDDLNTTISRAGMGMGTGAATSNNAITEGMKDFTNKVTGVESSNADKLIASIDAGAADTKSGLFNIISTLYTLIQAVIGSMGGTGGGGSGILGVVGAIASAFSGGGAAAAASGASSVGTTASSLNFFGDGGIVNEPTKALIGEAGQSEAVVPLPNNREIPVQLNGAAGDTISIEQNFDFRNTDSSAIPLLRQEARAIEERTFNRVFSEINRGGRYAKMSGRR